MLFGGLQIVDYPKPPLSIKEQIELLKSRGLIIQDEGFAEEVLSCVSYYRLSGYTLTLKTNNIFHNGITFDLHEPPRQGAWVVIYTGCRR